MRSLPLIALGFALVFLSGCASPTSQPPNDSAPTAATERVVIRPVTQSGQPAEGFTASTDTASTVDCGSTAFDAQPSPVAVDDNILICPPSSAYAVACWKDAAPSTVICYRDPWNKELVRMPNTGSFPDVSARANAQPLGLLLSDGDRCLVRSGGVWNDLAQHPGWYGTYSCADGGAVWAASGDGIDRSSALWSVEVASISGAEPLDSRDVVTAYYLGTKSE